nr:reverse transcriptase domain-containing protein [Tanacetum cinerariifolium]
MRSIISMVSIILEGFLPSILLMVVIIVAVVIVAVILVVVVIDPIVRVVIVIASIRVVVVVGVSFIIKLLLVIIGLEAVTFPSILQGKKISMSKRYLVKSVEESGEMLLGKEHDLAFQTLKDKLCNAPVLALPDGPEDFMLYCDASGIGLGYVLIQRELFSDYDCEIRYHPGKANVVADALSRKKRVKSKRVGAINMTLHSSIKDRILVAQKEAVDVSAGL